MSNPAPSFSVKVDVTNPGQFFACCGLLELAHRLWPGAEGWFDGEAFCVSDCGALREVITLVKAAKTDADSSRGVEMVHPVSIILPERNPPVVLDWWLAQDWYRHRKAQQKKRASLMSSPLRLWGGQQKSAGILQDLKNGLPDGDVDDLFQYSRRMTGRLGVDPRAAWNALDAGFSPNDQSMPVNTFPAVEFLAAVGLQRCRLAEDPVGWPSYATWSAPLPAPLAASVAVGLVPANRIWRYRFRIAARGGYKGFTFAVPIGEIP